MRLLTVVFLLAAAGWLGCAHPPGQVRKAARVEASHLCVATCDHVWIDGDWYVQAGHKHGKACGHEIVHGKWVAAGMHGNGNRNSHKH